MKRLVALGFAALVVAGCSNDDGVATPSTAPVSVATSVTDTTVVSTTTSPPSSTPSSTIAPTTLPATTTTVPAEDLIKQAVQDYVEAYHDCGAAPDACVPDTFTATNSRSRSTITGLVTEMTQQGIYFAADQRGSHVSPLSVEIIGSSQAIVTSCWYDAGVVLGPIGPDGLPTIVNDETGSSRYTHTLLFEAGSWRVAEQSEQEDLGSEDSCVEA